MVEADAIIAARALLRQFAQSDLRSCHVATDALELFLSRDRDACSPIGAASAPVEAATAGLCAPHLGTVAELAPPGTPIAPGGCYGTLAVLDEARELLAEHGGIIVSYQRAVGDLVEFGDAIALIAT